MTPGLYYRYDKFQMYFLFAISREYTPFVTLSYFPSLKDFKMLITVLFLFLNSG